ncbi:MAG TPA: creatininase family protein, partial [Blastocatellia bacterium]
IISEEMSRRAVGILHEEGIDAFVLPPIAYSVTDFSAGFPGTISIRKETAMAVVRDICVSLYREGARLVAIANSHLEPEHIASIESAIAAVQKETGRTVVFPDKRRRRWADRLTEEFRRGDCHAGSYETSLVMAARPDLVRESVRTQLEPVPISIARKIQEGATTFEQAGGNRAYFGDPASASVEEGEHTYRVLASMLAESVLEALKAEGAAKP